MECDHNIGTDKKYGEPGRMWNIKKLDIIYVITGAVRLPS